MGFLQAGGGQDDFWSGWDFCHPCLLALGKSAALYSLGIETSHHIPNQILNKAADLT